MALVAPLATGVPRRRRRLAEPKPRGGGGGRGALSHLGMYMLTPSRISAAGCVASNPACGPRRFVIHVMSRIKPRHTLSKWNRVWGYGMLPQFLHSSIILYLCVRCSVVHRGTAPRHFGWVQGRTPYEQEERGGGVLAGLPQPVAHALGGKVDGDEDWTAAARARGGRRHGAVALCLEALHRRPVHLPRPWRTSGGA